MYYSKKRITAANRPCSIADTSRLTFGFGSGVNEATYYHSSKGIILLNIKKSKTPVK